MKIGENLLPQIIYEESLSSINGIKFTIREIDIIACLITHIPANKISQLLSIVPKTVQNHTYNIMQKLGVNSPERIIDFVEKSSQIAILKKYSDILLVQISFENNLIENSSFIGLTAPECLIYYCPGTVIQKIYFNHTVKHLRLAGVKVVTAEVEEHQLINYPIHKLNKQMIGNIILIIAQTSQAHLVTGDVPDPIPVIFLYMGEFDVSGNMKEGDTTQTILLNYNDYYESILALIKKISPTINIDKISNNFKEQGCHINHFSEAKGEPVTPSIKVNHFQRKSKYFMLLLAGLISVAILSFILIYKSINRETYTAQPTLPLQNVTAEYIRSDLIIPTSTVILNRNKIIFHIDQILRKPKGIQTLALVGIGGSGKSTIARQYAQNQKSKVIWEINAETNDSLISSFEQLAYALAKTAEQQKSLRSITDMPTSKERSEKLLLYVKGKLRAYPNWLLLYDNVEKFSDIQEYFPQEYSSWGSGRVVITTRNGNIKYNKCMQHIIYIDELTPNEKLILFDKITFCGELYQYSAIERKQLKIFLNKLPNFPLDISIAAHYLKSTGISYEKYLEHLKNHNKHFENTQKKVLNNSIGYSGTRYDIITLSVKQLIESNKEFEHFLFFISIVDSQNIPKVLLDAYKDSSITDSLLYNLNKYSLITKNNSPSLDSITRFSMHRSTQEIIYLYLMQTISLKRKNLLIASFSNHLEKYIEGTIKNSDFATAKSIITHCEVFLAHDKILTKKIKRTLKKNVGILYFYLGAYINAKINLEESLQSFNPEDIKHRLQIAKIGNRQ